MSEFGPDRRALFQHEAASLYEEIVAQDGIAADDPRITEGAECRAAFELLLELDLVILDRETEGYVAVDPSTVQSRVVGPLGVRGAELIAESAEWARAFGSLSQAWRKSPQSARGPLTEIHGPEAIQSYISGVVADAEEELLTAQPQTGRDAAIMAAAAERDTAALERGVRMRTLYQHSARRSSVTHQYVAAVTAKGAEVRTLDEFFNRIIIVDRRIAVIPGKAGLAVALSVREPNMIAYLVDIFERTWERARPFTNRETSLLRDIAAEQRAMTIRMLIEGHADPVSAKRLGVSPRTYAGYVADLKSEYEAETRFQLGYVMGQRGISGRERTDASAAQADG
ncbi:LuxR family transcriptional regulator [Nocardioides sp. GCM10027113]|uniref:LuxR family transcriptional regulator n=1 Tax=unclassified Nocardioides TaxID=2615069 RepID=UPI00360CA8E6